MIIWKAYNPYLRRPAIYTRSFGRGTGPSRIFVLGNGANHSGSSYHRRSLAYTDIVWSQSGSKQVGS